MAKWQNDLMLDEALNWLKSHGTYGATKLCVCSGQPANYTQAVTAHDGGTNYNLATAAINSSNFTGPADGAVSGRKLTVNQQTNIAVTTSGTATHIALTNADTLLYVTTCTSQVLTSGNTVTVPAWVIELSDAT